MDSLKKRCGCGAILGLREGCAVCAGKERARLEAKRQEEAAKVPFHLSRKAGMSVQGITGWAHEMMGSNAGVEPRFKVGDLVRHLGSKSLAGLAGEVVRVGPSHSVPVYVDWGGGSCNHYAHELELIPEKFKVGDRVRVRRVDLEGKTGHVLEQPHEKCSYYKVAILGSGASLLKREELELIPEPKP